MKLYEKYKIDTDFEQDVKDIFVELTDNEYQIDIDFLNKDNGLQYIMVNIEKDETFNSNIVKDNFLMLLDYINAYYEVLTCKFASYQKVNSRTLDGQNTFTTNTTYYDEFPEDINELECIGIDIIMKSNTIISEIS